jgi:hypothetical protein
MASAAKPKHSSDALALIADLERIRSQRRNHTVRAHIAGLAAAIGLLMVVASCGHGDPEACKLVVQPSDMPSGYPTSEHDSSWLFADKEELAKAGVTAWCLWQYGEDQSLAPDVTSEVKVYNTEAQAKAALAKAVESTVSASRTSCSELTGEKGGEKMTWEDGADLQDTGHPVHYKWLQVLRWLLLLPVIPLFFWKPLFALALAIVYVLLSLGALFAERSVRRG